MEQNIFVPAQRAAELADILPGPDLGQTTVHLGETLPELPLSVLRCYFITLHGSRTFVRTPFVFPFLLGALRANYRDDGDPLELRPGVDCLYLGGSASSFREFLVRFCRRQTVSVLNLRPFERLVGPLPQSLDARDLRVELTRTQRNHNQPWWVKLKQELLDTPEQGWGGLKQANTTDWAEFFAPHLDLHLEHSPQLILDLGCGLGQTARSLALRYPQARVIGLDLSAEAIEVARAKFVRPNLEFLVGDLSSLALPAAEVDLIVSANALGYATNPVATATTLFRALKPSGLFLNYCRLEESHAYWEFPRSLLLPTGEQLQQADWIPAGARHGFGCRMIPGLSGFNLSYFYSWQLGNLQEMLPAVVESLTGLTDPGPAPYFTHALYLFSGQFPPEQSPKALTAPGHLTRLAHTLASVVDAPDALREATVISWAFCATKLALAPQAVQFMRLALPGVEPILDAVFTPQTVAAMQ